MQSEMFKIVLILICLHLCKSSNDVKIDSNSDDNSRDLKPRHKSVMIGLYSNWFDTPLYLESAQFLSQENNEFIWLFIESLYRELGPDSIKSMSDRNQYDIIIQLCRQILQSESKVAVLKYSLSLRSYSPSVAMFNQVANELIVQEDSLKNCDAFVEFSRPADSEASVDNYSRLNCRLSSAKASFEALNNALKRDDLVLSHPTLYKIDHIFPGSQSSDQTITAVLYGEIGTDAFQRLHEYLKELAKSGSIKYVIRHYIRELSTRKVSLSGYGVELAIKSTEYKAQDDTRVKGEATSNYSLVQDQTQKPDEIEGFVFSKLKTSFPEKSEKLDEFQTHLLDSSKEIATLKVWELQEISLQATKKILSSHKNDALRVLRDIAQNFPTEARSLIKISVDNDMKKEIEKNQQIFMQNLNLGTNDAALFVNGMYYDIDTVDVFTLLEVIKKEFKLVEGLHQLVRGDDEKLKKLIKLDINSDKQDFQIDIRDGAVIYVNDIENDKVYRNWPSSLQDMLRPTYPGMLRNVRRNMYHLVLIVDPSKKESHDILKLAESFYVHKAPVRIGIVFAVSPDMSVDGLQDAGVACLEAFNFISQDKTPYEGLSFLTDIIATVNAEGAQRDLKPGDVINQFRSKYKSEDLDLIFGPDSDYDTGRKLAWDFIHKTGIGKPIKALLNGVVLKETHLNAELFEEVVLTEIMKQTTTIQKAIYRGELTDSDDILEWLMAQKSVMPRLNRLILNTDGNSNAINKYIEFTGEALNLENIENYQSLSLQALQNTLASNVKYIKARSDKCSVISLWFASNYETKLARDMLLAAISHLRSNSLTMRLGVVYTTFGPVSKVIESAILAIDNSNHLLQFLHKFLSAFDALGSTDESKDAFEIAFQLIQEEYKKNFKEKFSGLTENSNTFKLHKAFSTRALSIGEKDSAIVLNGRVIQIPLNQPFVEDDFSLIEKYATTTFADKILSELSSEETDDHEKCSDLVLKISSVLSAKPQSKARYDIKHYSDKHSVLSLEAIKPDEPSIDFTVILDPLTRGAQKITPILMVLHKVFNSNIKIFFNCVDKHSEMPLKTFYRFVIDTEPKFSTNDEILISKAYFSSMPTSPLLTLGMAVPDNWLVESTESLYDLDNIHLDQVEGNGIWASFELEYLLLEGHCFEQSSGNPPRGLQFTLGTKSSPVMVDTIVMANLGYFQLKANPGSWNLNLRQGRSADIYSIISHEGTDSLSNSPDVMVLISSFKSNVIKIRVNKKPGKQHEELLYDSDDDDFDDTNSIWNSFSWSSNSNKKKANVNATEDPDSNRINVFSLATGHLYERLLRIMITSVLKNTQTPVKFWFLKNYLSPSFKNVLPFMAKKYNFEYELVQYKWPRWLHQQTEKQRIIWGYKILFLDVLFPLDIKKIIFVDADQVVRADLKELRDLDLEGAPYGYTPFCDSRKDMEGFRFWKSGYWATHLHGRKYHISALYVVDLQKFRRIAAGDRLRGQYQGLSQDPNSLSNLDQDLPNNMIHQVSIKSLPQDWLWCETWCDDESIKTAKTIDLCNNPKTKEPKLTSARRIVAEWEDYDNEIKAMLVEFEEAKRNGTINQILSQTFDPNTKGSDASKHQSHVEL